MTAEATQVNPRTEAVAIGIDVGSTTVKAVVVDPKLDPATGDVFGTILRIAPTATVV